MSERDLNEELAAVETVFRGLTPTASGIDRDRLLFSAGRASAMANGATQRESIPVCHCLEQAVSSGQLASSTACSKQWHTVEWHTVVRNVGWPCATAASLLVAATFAALWASGGKSDIAARTAATSVRQTPMAAMDLPEDASPPSPWENRRLCQLILEKGIEALPRPDVAPRYDKPLPPHKDSYFDLLKQFNNSST
jgi:hypothetical protein